MNKVMTKSSQSHMQYLQLNYNIKDKKEAAQPKAPAKRSQLAGATYRNIVGRNTLPWFSHPVAMSYDMLDVLAQV